MIPKYVVGDIIREVYYVDYIPILRHYMITGINMDRGLYTFLHLETGRVSKNIFKYIDEYDNASKVG